MMKKIWLLASVFCLMFFAQGVRADHSLIDIFLEGKYSQKVQKDTLKVNFKIQKVLGENYDRIKDDYDALKNEYNKDYDRKRKLVSESSNVYQVFVNSKNLLNTCFKYRDKFNDLKSSVLLELLVGKWNGKVNLRLLGKTKTGEWQLDRNLNVRFLADYAGIVYRGVIEGTDELYIGTIKKVKKAESISLSKKETAKVSGLISGIVVPKEESTLALSVESPLKFKGIEKISELAILGKTNVIITPFVTSDAIDEAYSLTVSHMKIYYNLLAKTRRPISVSIKNKYSLFFEDILYLLDLQTKGYISEEVYKALKIYRKSDYINEAYENYFISMINYYALNLSKLRPNKHKIKLLRQYLNEVINANSICNQGLIDKKLIEKLNININQPESLFDQVFTRYFITGTQYYQEKLANTENKTTKNIIKEDYKEFLTEIIELAKSGIFSSKVLQELNITGKLLDQVEKY